MRQWSEVYEALRILWHFFWMYEGNKPVGFAEQIRKAIVLVTEEITERDKKIRELQDFIAKIEAICKDDPWQMRGTLLDKLKEERKKHL